MDNVKAYAETIAENVVYTCRINIRTTPEKKQERHILHA